ncbi:PREDICTED: neuronal pentraxin receptor [Rhinopithecus bieti]|uniref:Neuronal pentraxin receptor n=1 Tax=Rhinopithecus bieti TaxID=61621 RepID=A0A2K6N299_RHIBE|nr:PREDICTED: neuronal pentraxin receptor [Rhinopithecus bieti]
MDLAASSPSRDQSTDTLKGSVRTSPAARPSGHRPLRCDRDKIRSQALPSLLAASPAAPQPGAPARNGCGAGPGAGPGGCEWRGRRARSPPAACSLLSSAARLRAPQQRPPRQLSSGLRAPAPAHSAPPRQGSAPTRRRALPGGGGGLGRPARRLTLKVPGVAAGRGMLAFLACPASSASSPACPWRPAQARALPGRRRQRLGRSGAARSRAAGGSLSAAAAERWLSRAPRAARGTRPARIRVPPGPLFTPLLVHAAWRPPARRRAAGGRGGQLRRVSAKRLLLPAEHGRAAAQTALQAGARIPDQDTIRELTGKLGRCESGLPRGLQGAGPRRDTMADGPWDSPALILELEDAVRALRDRIDRLEQELPARVNLSAAPAPVSAVPTGLHSKMDQVEGQLLAQVLALEKERAALSHSSRRQRQEVEKELDVLQGRVAELEHGSSAYSPPDAFKISIPIRNNYMYARVRKALPELYAFTACMWLRSRSSGTGQGTPFSYSVPGQANEIVLLEAGHEPMELLINDKVAQLPLSLKDNDWHHICVAWTTRDGLWSAYQDGELQGSGENLAAWHPIKPHGILILGQEQDTLGGRFDATQAFVGDIAQFNLWDHALTPAQVLGIANCTAPLLGNIFPWEDKLVEAFGGATKAAFDVCKGRAKA